MCELPLLECGPKRQSTQKDPKDTRDPHRGAMCEDSRYKLNTLNEKFDHICVFYSRQAATTAASETFQPVSTVMRNQSRFQTCGIVSCFLLEKSKSQQRHQWGALSWSKVRPLQPHGGWFSSSTSLPHTHLHLAPPTCRCASSSSSVRHLIHMRGHTPALYLLGAFLFGFSSHKKVQPSFHFTAAASQ